MADSPDTTALYDDLQSQVHIWYCNPLSIHERSKLARYESVLSQQETEQYHRFQYESDRHSYLVSHALLRHALSRYTDLPACDWQFSRNEYGKPEIMPASTAAGICFNLTHTDGLSACVISLGRRCGIDAEKTDRKNKLQAVAQRMFADEELAVLDNDIKQQFYHYWTLREAYVKALGTGLAGSSKEFYFNVDKAGLDVVLQQKDKQYANDKNWYFKLYEPTPEHVLAAGFESYDEAQIVMAELIP